MDNLGVRPLVGVYEQICGREEKRVQGQHKYACYFGKSVHSGGKATKKLINLHTDHGERCSPAADDLKREPGVIPGLCPKLCSPIKVMNSSPLSLGMGRLMTGTSQKTCHDKLDSRCPGAGAVKFILCFSFSVWC